MWFINTNFDGDILRRDMPNRYVAAIMSDCPVELPDRVTMHARDSPMRLPTPCMVTHPSDCGFGPIRLVDSNRVLNQRLASMSE